MIVYSVCLPMLVASGTVDYDVCVCTYWWLANILRHLQEVNELVQLFINIGESLPQQRQRLESMRREAMTESGVELLSFLDSCQLSLDVSGEEGGGTTHHSLSCLSCRESVSQ